MPNPETDEKTTWEGERRSSNWREFFDYLTLNWRSGDWRGTATAARGSRGSIGSGARGEAGGVATTCRDATAGGARLLPSSPHLTLPPSHPLRPPVRLAPRSLSLSLSPSRHRSIRPRGAPPMSSSVSSVRLPLRAAPPLYGRREWRADGARAPSPALVAVKPLSCRAPASYRSALLLHRRRRYALPPVAATATSKPVLKVRARVLVLAGVSSLSALAGQIVSSVGWHARRTRRSIRNGTL